MYTCSILYLTKKESNRLRLSKGGRLGRKCTQQTKTVTHKDYMHMPHFLNSETNST